MVGDGVVGAAAVVCVGPCTALSGMSGACASVADMTEWDGGMTAGVVMVVTASTSSSSDSSSLISSAAASAAAIAVAVSIGEEGSSSDDYRGVNIITTITCNMLHPSHASTFHTVSSHVTNDGM